MSGAGDLSIDVPIGTLSGQVFSGVRLDEPGREAVVVPRDLPPVAGATIRIVGSPLDQRSTQTGEFAFPPLPALSPSMKHTVEVEAAGFGLWRLDGVVVRPGGHTRLYVELHGRPVSRAYLPPEEREDRGLEVPRSQVSAAAGRCTDHSSNQAPPDTIRVLTEQHGDGRVIAYDFRFYVKGVLANEWVPSWPTEALRAGAMATKMYGWYWVNHWRGGRTPAGECFDVTDNMRSYQEFDPAHTDMATDNAVDDTFPFVVQKGGEIFEGRHQRTLTGRTDEACGAGANGQVMSQYGSKTCAEAGRGWEEIVHVYYDSVDVIQPR